MSVEHGQCDARYMIPSHPHSVTAHWPVPKL